MPATTASTNLDISVAYRNANTNYLDLFDDLFVPEQTDTSKAYAKTINVDSQNIRIDMLGPTPVMQKWLGPRIEKFLRAYSYTVDLDSYESSLWIKRKDIQYDKSGAIARRMSDYFKAMPNFYDKFAIQALYGNGTCYDGTALMNTAHPHAISGGTWSNYSTNSLNSVNLRTAEETAMAVTLENGEPADISFDVCLVGPKNETTARRLFDADERIVTTDGLGKEVVFGGGNATALGNIYKGSKIVVVDKRLRSTQQYYWYLVDSTKPYGAVIIMEGEAPRPTQRQDADDPRVWNNDEFGWGIQSDTSFAVGAPHVVSGHHATTGGW